MTRGGKIVYRVGDAVLCNRQQDAMHIVEIIPRKPPMYAPAQYLVGTAPGGEGKVWLLERDIYGYAPSFKGET